MTDSTVFTGYPFVSVVIAARNEEQYIGRCLESLLRQDYPHDRFEMIVADGGSTDRTRELVQGFTDREAPRLRLIENPYRGTAAGRNLAIKEAQGEVIVALDAHAEAAPNFLSAAVAALRESGADCVGGPITSVGTGITGRAIALALSSPFGVGNAAFRYSQREQWTDTVAYGAYRREVFDRIGLYDETIERGEDDEFNYRLLDAGGRILLTPLVRTIYYTRTSLGGLWRQYFGYGRAKVRVLQRHPARWRVRHFVPALFVSSVVMSGILSVFWRPARYLLMSVLGTYLLTVMTVTGWIALRAIALPENGRQQVGREGVPTALLGIFTPQSALPNRRGRWSPFLSLLLLPVTFPTIHIAYGLGFLSSLLRLIGDRQ